MELPPYMKVISGAVEPRRRLSSPRLGSRGGGDGGDQAAKPAGDQAEVLSLLGRQGLAVGASQATTPVQARAALANLQRDLPGLGQAVGDIHAALDRRHILVLLAPLVES